MLFSIIIPVYNVENYIEKCLDSIFSQINNQDSFEVIIVDDGSMDNTMFKVEKYEAKYKNIVVINKENGGVSSARNEGIKKAKGQYLLFLDADDTMENGSMPEIESLLKSCSAEMFILRSFMNDNERYAWTKKYERKKTYTGLNLVNTGYIRGSVCGTLILKSSLLENNVWFPEGVANAEDTIFMLILMCYLNQIKFVDIRMYNVLEREGSASRSYDRSRIMKSIKALDYVSNYMNSHSLDADQNGILNYLKYNIISNLTNVAVKDDKLKFNEFIRITNLYSYLPISCMNVHISLAKVKLMNFSYRLFYYLIKLKKKVFYV